MPQPHPTSQKGKADPTTKGSASGAGRLEDRTREDLYALARELQIPGFSEMSKAELVEAIRRR